MCHLLRRAHLSVSFKCIFTYTLMMERATRAVFWGVIAGCLVTLGFQFREANYLFSKSTKLSQVDIPRGYLQPGPNRRGAPNNPKLDPSCPSAEPGHIPSQEAMQAMNESSIKDIYHNYASNIEVVCQKMLRMGLGGDGGWEVCDDPHVRPPHNNCLVYSFGINYEFSFDDMVAGYYGCEVHSFDPSMSLKTSRRNEKVMFHQLGVSGDNTKIEGGKWSVNTLSQIREDLGHSKRRLDVLKMDIEGSEWPTLKTALAEGALYNITQLSFEIHGLRHTSKPELLEQLGYLRSLRSLGYRIFYAHKNPVCFAKYNPSEFSPFKTGCYEIHMLHIPSCAEKK